MAASSSSSDAGAAAASASDSDFSDRRRYLVDVRAYLALVATSMALAFAAGVSGTFGPPLSEAERSAAAGLLFLPPKNDYRGDGEVGVGVVGLASSPPSSSGVSSSSTARRRETSSTSMIGEAAIDAATGSATVTTSKDDDDGIDGEEEEIVRQPDRQRTEHSVELGRRRRRASEKEGEEEGGEEHLPQGQHLLMDIKNVDGDFLDSEERLSAAMTSVVNEAGLNLLSYHCHSLKPRGVSCGGILLESHIAFHTWPDEGVITLDLFTCGASPLLPMVKPMERLFGVPRSRRRREDGDSTTAEGEEEEEEKVKVIWAHELRGFRDPVERTKHYLDDQSDLASWVFDSLENDVKDEIVSTKTKYQRVDIWDVLAVSDTPSHSDAKRAGLKKDDPRWNTNEVCKPERMLFLDGTLQSLSDSEREYHESLVHPAMFAHPSPRRVAIVGGGEGATLREVLKHTTVEEAVMIEIDSEMVQLAREHLPYMNDCSDIEGSAPNCFDDPRSTLVYEDGMKWFIDRYGEGQRRPDRSGGDGEEVLDEENENELFDVIILDALDPEDETEFAEKLYTDDAFLSAMYASLTPHGVMVVQVGSAPSIHDPRPDVGIYANRETMFLLLESHPETAAMLVYEEAHCGFHEPHSFLVVCRSPECRERWYAEDDAVDYWIHERLARRRTTTAASAKEEEEDGLSLLAHYDGATQRSFQVPPRAWETVYCRREPEPFECAYRGLDPEVPAFELFAPEEKEDGAEEGGEGATRRRSSFDVEMVKGEDGKEGRPAVFAAESIPKGSYVMPLDLAGSLLVKDASLSNLRINAEHASGTDEGSVVLRDFVDYADRNGHPSMANGSGVNFVEVGATSWMRRSQDEDEANVGRWMPVPPSGKLPPYSPVYERHLHSFDVFLVATKDIKEGEELVKHEQLW